jgi:hypothetical protein
VRLHAAGVSAASEVHLLLHGHVLALRLRTWATPDGCQVGTLAVPLLHPCLALLAGIHVRMVLIEEAQYVAP